MKNYQPKSKINLFWSKKNYFILKNLTYVFIKKELGFSIKKNKNFFLMLLNLSIFINIYNLFFQELSVIKNYDSDDIIKKPKILLKKISWQKIQKSFLIALSYLNKTSIIKDFEKKIIEFKITKNQYWNSKIFNFYQKDSSFEKELINLVYQANYIWIYQIKEDKSKVIELIDLMEKLKIYLRKKFYQQANYILFIYLINFKQKID